MRSTPALTVVVAVHQRPRIFELVLQSLEHDGFRKTVIVNRAVLESAGESLVLVDAGSWCDARGIT